MSKPYDISPEDAVYLLAMLEGGPVPPRPAADLERLLGQVLLMARSVSTNCRDWLELNAMIHGDMYQHSAEKLNVPTVEGALACAVTVPRVDTEGCCATCAFRVGSEANQVKSVAEDVLLTLQDGEVFYCHAGHDDEYTGPRTPCAGWVAANRQQRTKEQE